MQTELLGSIKSISQLNGKLILTSDIAEAHISIYNPSVIRIHITRNPAEDKSFAVIQNPLDTILYTEFDNRIEINTGELILKISKNPIRFNFYTLSGESLSEDDPRFGTVWQGSKVTAYRKLHPDEKFIGLGEKTGNLNRRGSSYINWNTDAALYDLKTDPLYKTFPFFIGLHHNLCYGLFFDNTHKSFFDFGATTDQQMSWFGADGGDMNYYFFGSQSVPGILKDYTWLTGHMEMPPLWSLGYQQCRWSYMSAKEVVKIAKTFREKQIPADVMYCDIDYMDQYKIFTWDKEQFPDPKSMIDTLKAMGFYLVTIVDPGIKIETGYKQYEEGITNHYFATYPDGEVYTADVWPGRCHFPDFFDDDVRKWWGDAFRSLTEPGVAGFWNDMNEPAAWGQNIPSIVQFGDYTMPEVRNAYGMQMAKATFEGTKKLLNNVRPFVLTRAAYSGVQRYSAVWTGDNSASDEHMLLGQRLVNSLGITGLALIGVDIGGFTGNPTPELMVRWNSLGVYTPMFRNHAAIDTEHREPWIWGKENEKIIKKDIEQRYKLLPYIYSSFYQSHKSGVPVSRTLAIDYTYDDYVFDTRYQNQFLFGDSIMVSPVTSVASETDVYLPEGEWYRFTTAKKLAGAQVIIAAAPLDDLPVYIKAGAIIPMQSVVQNTSEPGDGILQLHIWDGKYKNQFSYYEDDGLTYNYQSGVYYERNIIFDPLNKSIIINAVIGSFTSKYNKIKLVLHGFNIPSLNIKMNNISCIINTIDATTAFFMIDNNKEDIKINYEAA